MLGLLLHEKDLSAKRRQARCRATLHNLVVLLSLLGGTDINTISNLQRCLITLRHSCPVLGKQTPLGGFSFSMARRGSLAGSLLSRVFPLPHYIYMWGTPSCLRVRQHFPLLFGSLFSSLGFQLKVK